MMIRIDNEKYTLFFSEKRNVNPVGSVSYIMIYPDYDNWNDFGFLSKIQIEIYSKDKDEYYAAPAFIGFIGSNATENGKKELVNRVRLANSGNKNISMDDCFVMLRTMNDYRKLVDVFGVKEAKLIAHVYRDVLFKRARKQDEKNRLAFLSTNIFTHSFLRNSDSYFTYKNAKSIFNGLRKENVDVLSNNMKITYKMAGQEGLQEYEFSFGYDGVLPKRIAIIIGENGVGKSQTLSQIANSVVRGRGNFVESITNNRLEIGRLLTFAPTSDSGITFPSNKIKNPHTWYKFFSFGRQGASSRSENINDLIVQLSRSEERIAESSRWEIFLNAISLLNPKELYLSCVSDNEKLIGIHDLMDYSEDKRLRLQSIVNVNSEPKRVIDGKEYRLSSGEMSFLRFFAQLSLSIENGTLLLLDEPETHLHPSFINKFSAMLDLLLSQTGSVAIIATHSVYFVREVLKEQVTVLRKKDGCIIAEKPRLSTFGADIGNISYFVFGESEPTHLLKIVERNILKKYKNWDDVYNAYKDDLSINTLTSLRESFFSKKER
ncbi:TPA: ATP-binding protein [Serratia marcescens]|nr:ATP-binding protein [Serratia marcescens]